MEVHEYCRLFPEMTEQEFAELCTSVAQHGVRQPVIVHEGKIVDGRHRERAAMMVGKPVPYQEWDGQGSLLAFVVDLNLHRRSLTTGQRAAIAVEAKDRLHAEYRERSLANLKHSGKAFDRVIKIDNSTANAQSQAAAMMQVSAGYVHEAERIREQSPETFEAVKSGRLTIPQAKRSLFSEPEPVPFVKPDDLDDGDDDAAIDHDLKVIERVADVIDAAIDEVKCETYRRRLMDALAVING